MKHLENKVFDERGWVLLSEPQTGVILNWSAQLYNGDCVNVKQAKKRTNVLCQLWAGNRE